MATRRTRHELEVLRALGLAVRRARESANLSQEGLAAKAGLDRTYVGGIERGERNPTVLSLQKLSDALEVKSSALWSRAEAQLGK